MMYERTYQQRHPRVRRQFAERRCCQQFATKAVVPFPPTEEKCIPPAVAPKRNRCPHSAAQPAAVNPQTPSLFLGACLSLSLLLVVPL